MYNKEQLYAKKYQNTNAVRNSSFYSQEVGASQPGQDCCGGPTYTPPEGFLGDRGALSSLPSALHDEQINVPNILVNPNDPLNRCTNDRVGPVSVSNCVNIISSTAYPATCSAAIYTASNYGAYPSCPNPTINKINVVQDLEIHNPISLPTKFPHVN